MLYEVCYNEVVSYTAIIEANSMEEAHGISSQLLYQLGSDYFFNESQGSDLVHIVEVDYPLKDCTYPICLKIKGGE